MNEVLEPSTIAPDAMANLRRRLEPALASSEHFVCFVIAIDRLERCKDDAARAELRDALEKLLRGRTELARASFDACDGSWWLVVPNTSTKDGSTLARALVESVRKMRVGTHHFTISIGIAASRPALRAEVLIEVAKEGLGVARNGGGDRAVHTDLYDLLQKKLTGHSLPAFKEVAPAAAPVAKPALRQVELPNAPAAASKSPPVPAPATATVERRGDEQVELLERRVAKLMSELALAEARIAQLERGTSNGIASIYREVQGLAPTERLFDQKRELMTSIFEANLALRACAAS